MVVVWGLQGGTCLSVAGGTFHKLQYSSVAPVSHIYTVRGVKPDPPPLLIEHDGLWILVHHLGHVSQDVLLGDDS